MLHSEIAFASPEIHENGVVYERFLGYEAALREMGIKVSKKNVYECKIEIEAGIRLGYEIASRADITAVFATADLLAVGIMSGLFEKGRRVPEDVSIIGFDDLYLSSITSPRLTTIHQDIVEKGRISASMLIDALEKKAVDREFIMPVSLVERNSVAEPRKN